MSTIFKKIIDKEIPAYIVYEDDLCLAFLDISQATKGHTLVVPKKEVENIFELDENLGAHLFKVTIRIAKAIKEGLNPTGVNILNNNGISAFQSVMHYHLHIIPRYDLSEIKLEMNNNASILKKEDYQNCMDLIIEKIKEI
ncbi:HIT family protein [Acholeplasma sp. OttesenSCG-928-E16]|nr:HIT family protein [Acholeplasma sp. OttesenSCG-928-E16]